MGPLRGIGDGLFEWLQPAHVVHVGTHPTMDDSPSLHGTSALWQEVTVQNALCPLVRSPLVSLTYPAASPFPQDMQACAPPGSLGGTVERRAVPGASPGLWK